MNLRNKIGELSNRRYKLPKTVIHTVVIAYALFGTFSVYETLKTQICESYENITRAKIITIRPTNTETRDRDRGAENSNQAPRPHTCYDYAEIYAEEYQVNAELLHKIIETFPEDYKTAIAIAKAESGLEMTARNYNSNGSMDCGLFQINSVHKPTWEQCNEIDAHLELAREIYDDRKWSAWCVYTNGKYLEYL